MEGQNFRQGVAEVPGQIEPADFGKGDDDVRVAMEPAAVGFDQPGG